MALDVDTVGGILYANALQVVILDGSIAVVGVDNNVVNTRCFDVKFFHALGGVVAVADAACAEE